MRYTSFVGPSYQSQSPNLDAERTINFYAEKSESAGAKAQYALYPTPGLEAFVVIGNGPQRALFAQDGRCFSVSGNGFYEVFGNGVATFRGSVALDTNPATICSNGSAGDQLFVVSGGLGYIYDLTADTLTQIADPGFPTNALMGGFLDGYFVVLQAGTSTFYLSALEDGTSWDALDVGQVSQSSDLVQAMLIDHREIWLFGSKTTGVWFNSGNSDFPFEPINGVFIQQGIIAPFTAQPLDNAVFWLGGNEQGAGIAYRAQQFTPVRISTHAVELKWLSYSRIDDAIGWTYQEEGHSFYHLYFPAADTSWRFDLSTAQWAEVAHWSSAYAQWRPYVGRCHTYAFDRHLIGDRRNGAIYDMSLRYYSEGLINTGQAV